MIGREPLKGLYLGNVSYPPPTPPKFTFFSCPYTLSFPISNSSFLNSLSFPHSPFFLTLLILLQFPFFQTLLFSFKLSLLYFIFFIHPLSSLLTILSTPFSPLPLSKLLFLSVLFFLPFWATVIPIQFSLTLLSLHSP